MLLFIVMKTIRVKIIGDGTKIGKHLHVVNFVLILLFLMRRKMPIQLLEVRNQNLMYH